MPVNPTIPAPDKAMKAITTKVSSILFTLLLSLSFLPGTPVQANTSTSEPYHPLAEKNRKSVKFDPINSRFVFQNITVEEFQKSMTKQQNMESISPAVETAPNSFTQNYVVRYTVTGPDYSNITIATAVNMNVQYIWLNNVQYVQFVSVAGSTNTYIEGNNAYQFSTTPSMSAQVRNGGASLGIIGSLQLENTINITLNGSIHYNWFTVSGSVNGSCRCRSKVLSINTQYNFPWIGMVM